MLPIPFLYGFLVLSKLVPSEVEGVEGTVTRDRSGKYPGKTDYR